MTHLLIQQEASAGIIIASSILSGRALAPVDLAIANWKGFVAARQSGKRLDKLLAAFPTTVPGLRLPAPTQTLAVEALSVAPPGIQKLVVHDVSFTVKAGSAVGVIGPSAAGKSSLVRAVVGLWRPVRGFVRLDGASVDQWQSEDLGRSIGYLPQDVELIEGTIGENIARLEREPAPEAVIAAAKAAGVHELIVGFPAGYDTQIGEQGSALSAGQAQRIALARAVYRDPFMVVLDEPNSNLDSDGEEALTQAILGVRERNGIVVVIAHRPSAIAGVDRLMMMNQGRIQAIGPKDEVLAKVLQRPLPGPRPLKVVPDSGSAGA